MKTQERHRHQVALWLSNKMSAPHYRYKMTRFEFVLIYRAISGMADSLMEEANLYAGDDDYEFFVSLLNILFEKSEREYEKLLRALEAPEQF